MVIMKRQSNERNIIKLTANESRRGIYVLKCELQIQQFVTENQVASKLLFA
jgi:hypothetical protein